MTHFLRKLRAWWESLRPVSSCGVYYIVAWMERNSDGSLGHHDTYIRVDEHWQAQKLYNAVVTRETVYSADLCRILKTTD